MTDTPQSKGGEARAKSLSKKERSDIARRAAIARHNKDLPVAHFEGDFSLGSKKVDCAVLPNKTRVIAQASFLRAIGRSRSPKAGTGVLSTVDDLPFFLQAKALEPFIDNDLVDGTGFLSNGKRHQGRRVRR